MFGAAFFFGISDGATGIAFRPRLVELGISAAWALGLIQAGLTASRLFGVTIYRHAAIQNPARAGFLALAGSAFFYWLYANLENPTWALISWLVRVALLAGYFPIIRAVVSQTDFGAQQTSSALSALSVVTLLGSMLFSLLVSRLSATHLFSTTDQLKAGAVASLAAGIALLASQPRRLPSDTPSH